jgi:hypothetical protein
MKIRIGKDIHLKWTILTDGESIPLQGRNLTLELKSPSGKRTPLVFTIKDNALLFTWYGTEQKRVGDYILTLWENKGMVGQSAVDLVPALTLVEYSTQEDDSISGDIQSETLDLGTSSIERLGGCDCDITESEPLDEILDSDKYVVVRNNETRTITHELLKQSLEDKDTKENLIKTTWSELKALRDNKQLIVGCFYRITDYVTTTTQADTKSANHPFDVIVLATNDDTLGEEALAVLHEGDTYFADSNLSAWKLWYSLDNNKECFEWADEASGKGVIYRLIDEHQNDCPYDFKNILFYNIKLRSYKRTEDNFYYTFSGIVINENNKLVDLSVVKAAYGNIMRKYSNDMGALVLNGNILHASNTNVSSLYRTKFNYFDFQCSGNTLGGSGNYFAYGCYDNILVDYSSANTFGQGCNNNVATTTFGTVYNNTFGESCSSNTINTVVFKGNVIGKNCQGDVFATQCAFNNIGHDCKFVELKGDFMTYCVVDSGLYRKTISHGNIENKRISLDTKQKIKIFSLVEQYELVEELNNKISEQNKTINELITRIEALEQGSSANVTENTLVVNANVSNGVMSVKGGVNDGILKL